MSLTLTPFTPLKLLRHSEKVSDMLAGKRIYPVSVEFDMSNSCPHDCPFCSFGTSKSHGYRQQNWVQFKTARAVTLMSELAECGVESVTFTGGGEPLVHKEAAAILEACVASGLQFGVVSNGFNLRGPAQQVIADHATFLRVSLDAGTPETHQFTHGTPMPQFHQIISNMRATRELAGARNLTIGASFCVMDQNWKEIYAAAKAVKDAGGNYLEVRPTFPTDWRGDGWGNALSPENVDGAKVELEHARQHLQDDHFSVIGLIDRFDAIAAPEKRYSACRIGPLVTVIGADGRLWHCCVQRGQEFFNIASVADKSFKDAWNDAHERNMSDNIDLSKCPRCRHDGANRIIEDAFIADKMHASFL
jgi:MoaA/NifB/PqqE/SkfB family radical SAM enzyme